MPVRRGASRALGGSPHRAKPGLPVLSIAVALRSRDTGVPAFRHAVAICLHESPGSERVRSTVDRPTWAGLPALCGYKVSKPLGANGKQRRATPAEKREQVERYVQHLNWATECGIEEHDFLGILKEVSLQDADSLGRLGLPPCMRCARGRWGPRSASVPSSRVGSSREEN